VIEPCAAQVERDDMIKLDILHAALRWWRACLDPSHGFICPMKRAPSSNVANSTPGPLVGSITRVSELEIIGRWHASIMAHPRRSSEAPIYLPRGFGSASEAHCPARLGPGGAFFICENSPMRANLAYKPIFPRKRPPRDFEISK
jgi:hypothetical protein